MGFFKSTDTILKIGYINTWVNNSHVDINSFENLIPKAALANKLG